MPKCIMWYCRTSRETPIIAEQRSWTVFSSQELSDLAVWVSHVWTVNVPISCLGILHTVLVILESPEKKYLVGRKFHLHGLFCCESCYGSDIKVGMGEKGTDYTFIWHVFRSTRILFVIVQLQGILKRRYTCLLPTLFLTKSFPTLT